MPFDSADFNPWNPDPNGKPPTFWKETIRDVAFMALLVPPAFVVSGFVGFAIDGFHTLPSTIPPPPGFPPASVLAQAGAMISLLFLLTTLGTWLVRRALREIDVASDRN